MVGRRTGPVLVRSGARPSSSAESAFISGDCSTGALSTTGSANLGLWIGSCADESAATAPAFGGDSRAALSGSGLSPEAGDALSEFPGDSSASIESLSAATDCESSIIRVGSRPAASANSRICSAVTPCRASISARAESASRDLSGAPRAGGGRLRSRASSAITSTYVPRGIDVGKGSPVLGSPHAVSSERKRSAFLRGRSLVMVGG